MTNNIFYKVLATIGTLGIILIAGMQVYTTFNKKNNTEAEISKTLIELKKARKEAMVEVKILKKEFLDEIKKMRSETTNDLKLSREEALNAIKKESTNKPGAYLLLRFGAVERGGGYLEKIPMKNTSECELQGAIFTGSKRLWPAGDARGFECIELEG